MIQLKRTTPLTPSIPVPGALCSFTRLRKESYQSRPVPRKKGQGSPGARGVLPEKCRRITMAVILASFVQRVSLRTSDRCHWCGNPFPSLPLRVVLRAASQNLTIARGNCSIVYRWHGEAVTDEGLASPFGRGTQCRSTGWRGRFLPSQSLRDSSPREGAKGERRERIATPVCGTGSQ